MTTVAVRAESVIRDTIASLMQSAGFRRKRLVFRRVHGELVQVVQAYVRVTVSGGSSPPEGFMRFWIGLGPAALAAEEPTEDECGQHFELYEAVPVAHRTWTVPPTRGPRRSAIAADLEKAFKALVATLDLIKKPAQASAIVEEATQNRICQREALQWPKKHPKKKGG